MFVFKLTQKVKNKDEKLSTKQLICSHANRSIKLTFSYLNSNLDIKVMEKTIYIVSNKNH